MARFAEFHGWCRHPKHVTYIGFVLSFLYIYWYYSSLVFLVIILHTQVLFGITKWWWLPKPSTVRLSFFFSGQNFCTVFTRFRIRVVGQLTSVFHLPGPPHSGSESDPLFVCVWESPVSVHLSVSVFVCSWVLRAGVRELSLTIVILAKGFN